uniref:Uncharacterized protein n=1 Tax=Arundo donax TaxID=35708 RepID=A0A0A9DBQ4_ARUDO
MEHEECEKSLNLDPCLNYAKRATSSATDRVLISQNTRNTMLFWGRFYGGVST